MMRGGEVVFNYTKPGSDELNYYTDISREIIIFQKKYLMIYG